MADDTNKPTNPDASGAGTKAHKPTKAEQAKLPGGEDFDVEGASSEDFDKHFDILQRRSKLAGLQAAPAAPVPVMLVDPLASSGPAPQSDGITKIDRRNGNPQTLPQKAWDLLAPEDLAEFEDAPVRVPKPANI